MVNEPVSAGYAGIKGATGVAPPFSAILVVCSNFINTPVTTWAAQRYRFARIWTGTDAEVLQLTKSRMRFGSFRFRDRNCTFDCLVGAGTWFPIRLEFPNPGNRIPCLRLRCDQASRLCRLGTKPSSACKDGPRAARAARTVV